MGQFKEVSINIDYSNINESQMFIFENFEYEIKSYFINNYFFDEMNQSFYFIILNNLSSLASGKPFPSVLEVIRYR